MYVLQETFCAIEHLQSGLQSDVLLREPDIRYHDRLLISLSAECAIDHVPVTLFVMSYR